VTSLKLNYAVIVVSFSMSSLSVDISWKLVSGYSHWLHHCTARRQWVYKQFVIVLPFCIISC